MAAESLRIRGGGAFTMPVCAFRMEPFSLLPPAATLSPHLPFSIFVSLYISSFTPSIFPVVPRHHQSNAPPLHEPPSSFPPQFPPPPPVLPYYGTFQGIPTYPPSTGIPQPAAASSYYNTTHAYQFVPVPGYVVDEERPLIRDDRLPCCGIGLGWCLFLLGFFFGAIPWYIGAMILLCSQRRVDYREKPGYILCTIVGCCIYLLLALGWALAAYVRNREIKQMKNSMKDGNNLAFLSHEIKDLEYSKQVNFPRVTVVMPLKGFGAHNLHNWRSQITTLYGGTVDFLFTVESTEDPAYRVVSKLLKDIEYILE